MYVIFPADELILMTYGAVLPRVKPRPTLDCLSDPQVPLDYPKTNTSTSNDLTDNNEKQSNKSSSKQSVSKNNALKCNSAELTSPVAPADTVARSVVPTASETTVFTYDNVAPLPLSTPNQTPSSLPPATPIRRTSRASVTHPATPPAELKKRSSLRSSIRTRPPTPPTANQPTAQPQRQLNSQPVVTAPTVTFTFNATPMYNDASMQPQQQQLQHQQQQATRTSTAQSSPIDSRLSTSSYTARERSPSILLEPPTPTIDPTQSLFAPGWGRPMSPMELPPEPHYHQAQNKSPTSKSRLRPKIHLPLGRLGRTTSTDQRESLRLREDLQLEVENPIFNTENLRQRNFDAFFESGEPKYKLQPKTPQSASSDTSSLAGYGPGYSPSLDKYAGVYDSASHGRNTNTASRGSLFAPPTREQKALTERTKSVEQFNDSPRDTRAASISGGSVGRGASGGAASVPQKDSLGKSSSGRKNRSFFGWRGPRSGSLGPPANMASYNGVLKDYGHSSLNEAFKSQNNVNFKLIKTVSDFTETLSQLYEEHATALQTLVSTYRKKNGELRKERPACHLSIFQAWETFLQEVETDSQASNDVASVLSRQVSRPMLDKSFHRKVQSRKIFTHRESFETIIAKTEEKLSKCRLDYKQFYLAHRQSPTQASLTEYIDAHNAYVQQLHATNAMLEAYHCETMPQLMQELEEIHNDLCSIIADSILQGADVMASKANDQAKRYNCLTIQCSSVSPTQDLTNFVRILPLPPQAQKVPRRIFAPPLAGETEESADYNDMTPILRNELVFDRHSTLSLRPALESLKREAIDLELQIRQLQDAIDTLNRTQSRGLEGQLFNKVNEMQEDLSIKKFDLRAKQLHLAAIKAQKELFVSKVEPSSPRAERKYSSAASAPSMKTKWLKAFKSLKPAAPADRRNGAAGTSSQVLRPNEDGSHHLQEYTYKKITACDVCSQILRGHTRQGLRCRICKLNAHGDCASQLPRCQPKQKLLRRQKSTSEIENRIDAEEEIAEIDTETARPFGEPLRLNKKILKHSKPATTTASDSNAGSRAATPTAAIRRVRYE